MKFNHHKLFDLDWTGFDVEAGETMWTSYTLKQPQLITSSLLWRLDPRLEKNQKSLCERLSNGIDDSSNLVPFFPYGRKIFF